MLLREWNKASAGNRFLVFTLFPDANVEVRLFDGHQGAVVIAVGHSIFNRSCKVNVGEMLSGYGGGGPYHSQQNETWFAHSPGLKVVCPAFPLSSIRTIASGVCCFFIASLLVSGPLPAQDSRLPELMASCGVSIGEPGPTSHIQGEALTVPRCPILPRS